jgi:transcriptional regulator with PAS, ATPase and Fis domain
MPVVARNPWSDAFRTSAEAVRSVAMKSLFERLEALCEGAVAVNTDGKIIWINKKYAERWGLPDDRAALGKDIEEVIPNSRMREVVETGQPIVLDIMDVGGEHCVVTRIPLQNDAGELIGAVGFVLYNRIDGLKPLLAKVSQLQARLTAAERELVESRRAKYSLASFLGISAPCLEIKRQARRAAQLDATVLLTGETGTGKELLAHAIHNVSPRAGKNFVSVNTAAIPENLLEAELFGAAPGAYTGADRKGREGKFKLADGGTMFLDEIGDMPIALQAKLLRVLQEQEIEPLGTNRVTRIDVRVIAATSVDLAARVAEGRFRSDLYYRLNVLQLALPPLRARLDDLPLLTERLLDDISIRIGQPLEISPDAIEQLSHYHWPGNVRELRNILERALLMNETQRLRAEHIASVLPRSTRPTEPSNKSGGQPGTLTSLAQATAEAERSAIAAALNATSGNKVAAAHLLGISRAALYQKLETLGLTGTKRISSGNS